ncbi:type IV-A pilus assembly ATPase PilB, partial [Vibrio parahaemolyticus]|nr:type IV-A pilus assembly ATPase PilB [Vibrio parahaemolyticus]
MLTNLSTVLRQAGILTFSQEELLLEQAKAAGISMPEALLNSGLFQSHELTEHLSSVFGLSCTSLNQYEYASLCQTLGLRDLITRHNALPLNRT